MEPNICSICREKNYNSKLDVLRKLDTVLKGTTKSKQALKFNWGIHSRCKYGMPCSSLQASDREAEMLAKKIEPRLAGLLEDLDRQAIQRALGLLRGNFPEVYSLIDREHKKKLRQRC